ncbi:fluoride efflux transporter CrcB [Martelella lutilitoris]|uniref:Fluoride-specific ion channel FluC n=1 Tax=Martelella lutilitoris TaxID=2583532 RepID=A0A7T7HNN0_9HYPH|nr:fluoride efflux transporter CrcB [Martelella lutilitoris]QQM32545.1 fluoride efflux transporter CrcB [Martelella lutilitoris]
MSLALLTATGGAIGSLCRWLVGLAATRLWSDHLPWGTLIVNILGSFIIGFAVELITHKLDSSPEIRALVVTGFLGGFTTFSSFSLDNMNLVARGDSVLAVAYILVSVLVSLVFVFSGFHVARQLS